MFVVKVTTNYPNGMVGEAYYQGKFMGMYEFSNMENCKHFDSSDGADQIVKELEVAIARENRIIEIVEVS